MTTALIPLDPEFEYRLSLVAPHFRADARRMPENVALAWLLAHLLVAAATMGTVPLAVIADSLLKPDPSVMGEDRAAKVVGAIVASVLRAYGCEPTGESRPTGKAWPGTGALFAAASAAQIKQVLTSRRLIFKGAPPPSAACNACHTSTSTPCIHTAR